LADELVRQLGHLLGRQLADEWERQSGPQSSHLLAGQLVPQLGHLLADELVDLLVPW
jgi:hypothetical protein